jgi:hypothetical protein
MRMRALEDERCALARFLDGASRKEESRWKRIALFWLI